VCSRIAVVLWNTRQIERIVTDLRASEMSIRNEDLVHIWPLQRRHITPNGVYFANRTMPAFILPDPVETAQLQRNCHGMSNSLGCRRCVGQTGDTVYICIWAQT
jgi:hypothetical protein